MKEKFNTFVILGLQWGDEGKGNIISELAKDADYVVRYQGGNNAGHTVYPVSYTHLTLPTTPYV